ncbi:MAG: hypothetical protein ACYDDO_04735 [Acidiferrobacterales bacterium]
MNDVATLIASLDPQPIYDAADSAARYIATTFTPTLLIIAVYLRTLETELDALTGEGRFARALRDIALWGTVLALYFGLATLLASFMNAVYRSVDRIGSLHLITDQLTQLVGQASAKSANVSGLDSLLDSIAANLVKAVMFMFYYVTLLVLAFLAAFLKVAHAIGYSIAFLWGLIAIPLSIISSVRLLRPWGHFFGTILLWPVVQALMLSLFAPVFRHAATALISDPTLSAADSGGGIYMLYSILNLIVSAILVAAPFIAHALVASGAAGSLITPFTAAAVAAGAGLARRIERSSGAGAFVTNRNATGTAASASMAQPATIPRPRDHTARPQDAGPGPAAMTPAPAVAPAGSSQREAPRRAAPHKPRARKRDAGPRKAQT